MAIARRGAGALILLLLCLVLVSCDAKFGRFSGLMAGSSFKRGRMDPNAKAFDVLSFGAKAGGQFDNRQAFIAAWQAACQSPVSAKLVIPRGVFLLSAVIFQGPCVNPIGVELKGNIMATPDFSSTDPEDMITFNEIKGLIITGGGTLDGQGARVWPLNECKRTSNCKPFPLNLKLSKVENAFVRGIHSINSKGFHIGANMCRNIRFFSLTIIAPEDSPNTDGIHISRSEIVRISKNIISSGDDCVSLGQGSKNVTVTKTICGPGHGISVGSLGKYANEEDVVGLIVKNCTLTRTDNGVRIKTWPGSPPSQAIGFLFSDIIMDNVRNPIIIDQNYCNTHKCFGKPPSNVKISDIRFENIRGTTITPTAVTFSCSATFHCQNIHLDNINLQYIPDHAAYGSRASGPFVSVCQNVKVGYTGFQSPPPCP
ncbi:Glycoside hydrolase, family 28 [Dillenia turbinata]|uniref:Glycoside hydrolase, family 28 n=1 Tax=Dillenia turbinata TaxID=194707 RepID=A0AAN8YUM7_9MAGN